MFKNMFKDGKLTIRSALYLDQFLVNIVMGFSAPITVTYFMANLTPGFIAMAAILIKLARLALNVCMQSKIAIKWVSQNFIPIMLMVDAIYLITALLGEEHTAFRHVIYNLIGATVIMVLKMVRKDNTCNCLKGTNIVTFNAACDSVAMVGSLMGGALVAIVLQVGTIGVTPVMIAESIVCMIAHAMQAYANYRVRGLIPEERRYTLIEVINDIASLKESKKLNEEDEGTSIFDQ